MTLTIRSLVDRDIAETLQYYLEEGSPSTAERFLDAVDVAYDEIIAAPFQSRTVEYGLREKKLKGFPLSVIYSVEESEIVIIGIYHDKRKRADLRARL